jgi:hypothetical protein
LLDYLALKRILAFRMNTGAVKFGTRFVRFGLPGMADILAFPKREADQLGDGGSIPLWIEAKAPSGRQSHEQHMFQQIVEADGHKYLLCRDSRELEEFLETL